jgi:hypothetical protein
MAYYRGLYRHKLNTTPARVVLVTHPQRTELIRNATPQVWHSCDTFSNGKVQIIDVQFVLLTL